MTRAVSAAALIAWALAMAAASTGCSVLLDWNGFSGGASDGATGADADAATDAEGSAPPAPCGDGGLCLPTLPTGWTGPVALYVGLSDAGAAPACPAGFAPNPAFDGSGSLMADPAVCSTCTCGAATGVTCADPVMSLFVDPFCSQPVGSPTPVPASCTPTMLGAFSIILAGPQPTGGACTPSGSTPTIPAPTWGTVARACLASETTSCGSGDLCAPAPPAPFSRTCVMESGAATSCPPGYGYGPQVFYTGDSDARGCAPCTCAAPTGGECTIGSPAVGVYSKLDCSTQSSTLNAPSSCSAVTGPDPVMLLSTPSLTASGACAAAGGSAVGVATPTGATSFCCVP